MGEEKPKVIVNEKIDKQVNSLALAITFILLGILLTVVSDFVGDAFVTSMLRWFFVVIGIVGLFSSFGNTESTVKGTSDIAAGVFVIAVAVLAFQYIPAPFGGVIALLILIFGLFGVVRGVLFVIYTMYLSGKQAESADRGAVLASVLEGLSKLAALALVIAQLLKLWAS